MLNGEEKTENISREAHVEASLFLKKFMDKH